MIKRSDFKVVQSAIGTGLFDRAYIEMQNGAFLSMLRSNDNVVSVNIRQVIDSPDNLSCSLSKEAFKKAMSLFSNVQTMEIKLDNTNLTITSPILKKVANIRTLEVVKPKNFYDAIDLKGCVFKMKAIQLREITNDRGTIDSKWVLFKAVPDQGLVEVYMQDPAVKDDVKYPVPVSPVVFKTPDTVKMGDALDEVCSLFDNDSDVEFQMQSDQPMKLKGKSGDCTIEVVIAPMVEEEVQK